MTSVACQVAHLYDCTWWELSFCYLDLNWIIQLTLVTLGRVILLNSAYTHNNMLHQIVANCTHWSLWVCHSNTLNWSELQTNFAVLPRFHLTAPGLLHQSDSSWCAVHDRWALGRYCTCRSPDLTWIHWPHLCISSCFAQGAPSHWLGYLYVVGLLCIIYMRNTRANPWPIHTTQAT